MQILISFFFFLASFFVFFLSYPFTKSLFFHPKEIPMKTYLKKSRFYYEEASWFDGQYWEKPLSVIKKDRFFLTQKK
jgi:hypothetical protein